MLTVLLILVIIVAIVVVLFLYCASRVTAWSDPAYYPPEPPQLTTKELTAIAREAAGCRGLTEAERRVVGELLEGARR